MMKIESVIPILYSDDVTRSIKYYTEVLCFKGSWTWDEGPSWMRLLSLGVGQLFAQGVGFRDSASPAHIHIAH
jgi:hypothetical protein